MSERTLETLARDKSSRLRDFAILAFTLLFPTLLTWGYFILGKGLAPEVSKWLYGVGKTLQFAFPAMIVALVLKERLLVRRFTTRGLALGVAFGLVVGFGIFLLGYLSYRSHSATSYFSRIEAELMARLQPLGLATRARFTVLFLFYSICHSGLEEYYWRWFAYNRVALAVKNVAVSTILTNAAFTLHHILLLTAYFGRFSLMTIFCSLGVFIGGVTWQTLYRRYDSIYSGWFSHALIDAGIFALGYLML
ncbi:MAG: CPBP family intramembrane metalloprotease [Planctomycetia bacterium]|nr:CPBP family intramembrane metalloprotease [Planctomycetia bacterium]